MIYNCSLENAEYRQGAVYNLLLFSSDVQIRVQEAIAEVAAELNPDGSDQQQSKAVNKVKKKARKILQEMVATVSPGLIR